MRMKKQAIDWKKIFANHLSDKGLLLEYVKNSQDSTMKNNVTCSLEKQLICPL